MFIMHETCVPKSAFCRQHVSGPLSWSQSELSSQSLKPHDRLSPARTHRKPPSSSFAQASLPALQRAAPHAIVPRVPASGTGPGGAGVCVEDAKAIGRFGSGRTGVEREQAVTSATVAATQKMGCRMSCRA